MGKRSKKTRGRKNVKNTQTVAVSTLSDDELASERAELVTVQMEKLHRSKEEAERTADIFIRAVRETEKEFAQEDLEDSQLTLTGRA